MEESLTRNQKNGPGQKEVTLKQRAITNSDEEAIVDFVKGHEELYDKTSEHFKDKARRVSLGRVCMESQAACQGVQDLSLSCKGHVTGS